MIVTVLLSALNARKDMSCTPTLLTTLRNLASLTRLAMQLRTTFQMELLALSVMQPVLTVRALPQTVPSVLLELNSSSLVVLILGLVLVIAVMGITSMPPSTNA